jgi:hypothetical protein
VRDARADALTAAYTRNPERFVRKHPEQARVTETEIDNFLARNHDLTSMSTDGFATFKRKEGYKEFFENKAKELKNSPDRTDRLLGVQLDHARRHGIVEYWFVTAALGVAGSQEVYGGYIAKQFRMDWQRDQ